MTKGEGADGKDIGRVGEGKRLPFMIRDEIKRQTFTRLKKE